MSKDGLALAYNLRKRSVKRYANGGQIPAEKLTADGEIKITSPLISKIADRIMDKRRLSNQVKENDYDCDSVNDESVLDLENDNDFNFEDAPEPAQNRRKILDGIMRGELK